MENAENGKYTRFKVQVKLPKRKGWDEWTGIFNSDKYIRKRIKDLETKGTSNTIRLSQELENLKSDYIKNIDYDEQKVIAHIKKHFPGSRNIFGLFGVRSDRNWEFIKIINAKYKIGK